jgi:hypothetical protein
VHARSKVLLDELGDVSEVPHRDLALLARDALEGQVPRALGSVRTLVRSRPNDPDVLSLAGEIELAGPSPGSAKPIWKALEQIEKSARAAFGAARTSFHSDDLKAAKTFCEVTLGRSPDHVLPELNPCPMISRPLWIQQ